MCIRDRPLPDPYGSAGESLLRYDHYRVGRLHVPWRVPVLLGKMPAVPQRDAPAEDRGLFALFLMLLFRPWRSLDVALRDWLRAHLRPSVPMGHFTADEVWLSVYAEYVRWRRDDVEVRAQPYFLRDTVCLLYTSPSPRDATLSRMPSSA